MKATINPQKGTNSYTNTTCVIRAVAACKSDTSSSSWHGIREQAAFDFCLQASTEWKIIMAIAVRTQHHEFFLCSDDFRPVGIPIHNGSASTYLCTDTQKSHCVTDLWSSTLSLIVRMMQWKKHWHVEQQVSRSFIDINRLVYDYHWHCVYYCCIDYYCIG